MYVLCNVLVNTDLMIICSILNGWEGGLGREEEGLVWRVWGARRGIQHTPTYSRRGDPEGATDTREGSLP